MNAFYSLPKFLQIAIAVTMMIAAFALMGLWFEWMMKIRFGWLLVFFLVPIMQFLSTPVFTLMGLYKYLTPMVLVYAPSETKYDLHNGTSFDYLLLMRNTKPGAAWRRKLLAYYIEALLIIIAMIESGELPKTVTIRGSSYFFSDRTAERMGFDITDTGWAEKINIAFNYLDLLWMYSLASGKLRFPKLKNIKTAKIEGAKLLEHKSELERLSAYLGR